MPWVCNIFNTIWFLLLHKKATRTNKFFYSILVTLLLNFRDHLLDWRIPHHENRSIHFNFGLNLMLKTMFPLFSSFFNYFEIIKIIDKFWFGFNRRSLWCNLVSIRRNRQKNLQMSKPPNTIQWSFKINHQRKNFYQKLAPRNFPLQGL